MDILGSYQNGNYRVIMFSDGTKVRTTNDTKFSPVKPESIDLKITNCCDMNCKFCHEGSSPTGQHGDIMNLKFIDTMLPYTEIAIGGGNPLSHPDLEDFLKKLKSRRLIANMTLNRKHFVDNLDYVKYLSKNHLVYGVGVSVTNSVFDEDIKAIKSIPNTVVHVINGIVPMDVLHTLGNNGLSLLILGYKDFRRGHSYKSECRYFEYNLVEDRMNLMHAYVRDILIPDKWFNTISFDNLAIKQLDIKDVLSKEEFDKMYMGDDGQFTMYIDAVDMKYAKSSVVPVESRFPVLDNIGSMFCMLQEDGI